MNNTIHFLNVKEGDCSFIQHKSGRNTLIDICNGNSKDMSKNIAMDESIYGNFKQKLYPVNPIEYLKKFNIKEIFRFILTHPDMDHMDGKNYLQNLMLSIFGILIMKKNLIIILDNIKSMTGLFIKIYEKVIIIESYIY